MKIIFCVYAAIAFCQSKNSSSAAINCDCCKKNISVSLENILSLNISLTWFDLIWTYQCKMEFSVLHKIVLQWGSRKLEVKVQRIELYELSYRLTKEYKKGNNNKLWETRLERRVYVARRGSHWLYLWGSLKT